MVICSFVCFLFVCLFVCSLVEASLVPSKEAGQEVSAVQAKCVPMCREPSSAQNRKIKRGKKIL